MKILCTICARKNSKGLKNKNIKKLYGEPLVARTILQAKKSKLFEDIIISTDSQKIQLISKKLGLNVWFLRPSSLSNDNINKVPVILHALKAAEKFYKKKYDAIVDLDVTAPLRKINDIKKAYNRFKIKKFDILISVCKSRKNPYFNMIEIKKNKIHLVKKNKKVNARQKAPVVYDVNASIYIWTRKALISKKSFFSKNTGIYVMPRDRSIDIDDKDDWNLVKFYLKKNENYRLHKKI
jgi:CMP-N,N'-diacetyllegionaminic acid synthase